MAARLTDARSVVAVVVAAQASLAELQTEVGEADGLTLAGTRVRGQPGQHEVTTFQVTLDPVHVLVAAEVPVRPRRRRRRRRVVCKISRFDTHYQRGV